MNSVEIPEISTSIVGNSVAFKNEVTGDTYIPHTEALLLAAFQSLNAINATQRHAAETGEAFEAPRYNTLLVPLLSLNSSEAAQ